MFLKISLCNQIIFLENSMFAGLMLNVLMVEIQMVAIIITNIMATVMKFSVEAGTLTDDS